MGFFRTVGLGVCAAWASGCSVPGSGGSATREWTVDLPPAVTAWICADACRVEHGGVDPLPMHAGAPIQRLGADSWQVRYDRLGDHGHRVFLDGRLLPPDEPRPGSVDDPVVALFLEGVRYQGTEGRTGAVQTASSGVTVNVYVVPGGGSRVVLWWRGGHASEPTWRHIQRLMELASDVKTTGTLLEEGHYPETETACAAALSRFASGCCAAHRPLAARLWMHRAMAQRALGALDVALTSAEVARGWDPSLPALDLWVAELAERLGRDDQAEAAWLSLELRATDRAVRLRAGQSRRRVQHRRTAPSPGPLLRADARRRLANGEHESARYLLDRAAMLDPYQAEGLALQRELHEERAEARRVLELTLLQAAVDPDPEVVEQLVHSWNEAGQPGLALRTLARHWRILEEGDPMTARVLLQAQVARLGQEHACRVLATERAHGLLPAQLATWASQGRPGRAAWSSLSRLEESRGKAILRGLNAHPPRPPR